MSEQKSDIAAETDRTTYELLVDSDDFFERLKQDIAAAKKSVYVQTLSFEGDTAGLSLARALKKSPATDKRVIIDYYTRYVLSDKFIFSPKNWFDPGVRKEIESTMEMIADLKTNGVGITWVNPVGFLFSRMPSRNHKKIITIDDHISYLGGINFSDHNFAWHDMMVRLENADITAFLKEDYLTSWSGRSFCGRKSCEGVEVLSFDGRSNPAVFQPIMDLIDNAAESIYVQSPYLLDPFIARLRRASKRGVAVTVVSPEKNNKKQLRKYIRWEAKRSGFDLWLYKNRMSHLKAMLIDDQYLIMGSSNFDYFSYKFEEETVAIITDPSIIAAFKDEIVERDQKHSFQPKTSISSFIGRLRHWQIMSALKIAGWCNRRP
jgi:cardiolipin synthase